MSLANGNNEPPQDPPPHKDDEARNDPASKDDDVEDDEAMNDPPEDVNGDVIEFAPHPQHNATMANLARINREGNEAIRGECLP